MSVPLIRCNCTYGYLLVFDLVWLTGWMGGCSVVYAFISWAEVWHDSKRPGDICIPYLINCNPNLLNGTP